jgi:hypothetical protein
MSRIILICALAAPLMGGACANGIKNGNQTDWAQARLACADVGIDSGSPAFGQCVFDLYHSLWNAQNVSEN